MAEGATVVPSRVRRATAADADAIARFTHQANVLPIPPWFGSDDLRRAAVERLARHDTPGLLLLAEPHPPYTGAGAASYPILGIALIDRFAAVTSQRVSFDRTAKLAWTTLGTDLISREMSKEIASVLIRAVVGICRDEGARLGFHSVVSSAVSSRRHPDHLWIFELMIQSGFRLVGKIEEMCDTSDGVMDIDYFQLRLL